ncbi:MAG: DUF4214 domain-containing protein [Acidobacteria bacterium]|nr:DUF4214 domain-containing protein [Acidobacteriota bacterium]
MTAMSTLSVLCIFASVQPAMAQDCGAWSRPVLCEAELVATTDAGGGERFGGRSPYRLAPRGTVDLQLEGLDQRGRRFPAERVVLGFSEAGCGRLLDVQDRGPRGLRITARTDAGRCRLQVWVPGNLNFEWDLEIEIDPGARTSYSGRDAEFIVEALYAAILDRGPDQQSRRSAVAEVQRGNIENLLNSMVRSREFTASRGAVSAEDLLDRFYRGIFSRDADSGGVGEYLNLVRSGRHTETLLRMIRSTEFERRLPG